MSTNKYLNDGNKIDVVNAESPNIKIFPNYYSFNKVSSEINSENKTNG